MWESWSAIAPDGKVGHISFNHYAFGCIGDWLYRHIGGIKSEQPGYKTNIIAPYTNCGLTWAKAEIKTGDGILSSSWSKIDNMVKLNIEVPANTTATVILPGDVDLTLNGELLKRANKEDLNVRVGSGVHQFEYRDNRVLNI
ncbi:alpha-L-rhamnosidase C-terminal domain-containing protein [Niallia sp. NCCP-28]|uniref:alpha-L-rhamnosidase C-terminal domain-containing protein n=1 Tax=Niallia sp. NCCP-28 TaxID=2934712 RepID=UPI002852A84F|nr:alpha-L-rhamnosidase C-terminal domain-containing protein [Niallia sp. NCCP-28]